MVATRLPKFNMDNSETNCCPRFDPTGWDGEEFEFDQRLFVRSMTVNFLHIPLNIGAVIRKTWKMIEQAGAAPSDEYLILSTDTSAWRGEHYFSVTKNVPDADMVKLSGHYLTKVFEGPYRDAGKWVRELEGFVGSTGRTFNKLYFFYTTCPKCAKHFGKNYVIGFAEV